MKYYGKEKCRILKEIRAEIARQNDIEWVVSECKHKGNCKGTCPKCEWEVRQLEAALAKREALGKTVAVVGVSASIALSVTGCVNPFPTTDGVPMPDSTVSVSTAVTETNPPLQGEIEPPETVTDCDLPTAGESPLTQEETTAEEFNNDILMGAPEEMTTEDTSEETTEADSEIEYIPTPGEVVVEGEFIEEPLMGDPVIEETDEETSAEWPDEPMMGAPVEMPTETETEEEPLMGEPIE